MARKPATAQPRYAASFDPWNSSATGHQRADSQPGAAWRDTRTRKLNRQIGGGHNGTASRRPSSTILTGSKRTVLDMLRCPPTTRTISSGATAQRENHGGDDGYAGEQVPSNPFHPGHGYASRRADINNDQDYPLYYNEQDQDTVRPDSGSNNGSSSAHRSNSSPRHSDASTGKDNPSPHPTSTRPSGGIFAGTNMYINGSTYPVISDHKLKHVLCHHGAKISIHLGRRTVTHVILGKTRSGNLAAGKLEKEMRSSRNAVYFVGVEW